MIFDHPDILLVLIDVFLAVAATSVAFALVALTIGIRDLRRPASAPVGPIGPRHSVVSPSDVRRAA